MKKDNLKLKITSIDFIYDIYDDKDDIILVANAFLNKKDKKGHYVQAKISVKPEQFGENLLSNIKASKLGIDLLLDILKNQFLEIVKKDEK